MENKNYFELDVDNPLFKKLEELSKSQSWWREILDDSELYVNIRKNNRIHVYYKGAAFIGELKYQEPIFSCQIHDKYIGKEGFDHYCKNLSPEEIMNRIGEIKDNIDKHYKKQNTIKQKGKNKGEEKTRPPEGYSEKELQGEYYINNKGGKYVDTEYAFINKKGEQIRIDFTSINNSGMIEFVELKRISDNRLLKKEGSSTLEEIIDQMDKYTKFIAGNKDEIKTYYEKVQSIMKKIGVNNPLIDREIKGVESQARLLFAPYKDGKEKHPSRINRVKRIAELLNKRHFKSNIDELKKEMEID